MSLPYISLGAKGLVSVASNRFPKEVSALVALALEGHLAQARACYHALAPLFEALFWETNPAPIKALLAQAGIIDHETLRLPLVEIQESTRKRLFSL